MDKREQTELEVAYAKWEPNGGFGKWNWEAFSAGFDAGHAAADDWVAIEDGMPDDHDWYLVAADYDGGIQGLTEINYFGGEFNERVIAWQPLPKPYQRPNDEEKNK